MSQFNDERPRARRHGAAALAAALAVGLTFPALAAASDTQGFIYGRITTESGKVYEGRLRWNGDEEAFWGDHFNSSKENRPFMDEIPGRARGEGRQPLRIWGIRIGSRSWGSSGRSFVARFGDIEKIEVGRGDEAVLTMKSGTEYEVDGGSNDLGSRIHVWDDEIGEVKLDWDRIKTIEFLPTPAALGVDVYRLHGKVVTDAGDFEGYIQWDQEECISTDKLDGESDDGDMSIDMGKIRAIERRSRRSSRVTLWSGREFVLEGTNDVDDDNRGIFVEDPRYGRVLVSWDAFERLDFSPAGASGPAYEDFAPGSPLRGKLTDADGKTYRGRIVYDVDEAETWELLNGDRRDVEYSIPFSLIAAIEPLGGDASRVILKSGEELELEDAADVGDGNAGVLVIPEGEDPIYFDWDDIERIDFDS